MAEDAQQPDGERGLANHEGEPLLVRHCPFCGELIGSFWGRTDVDGRSFCESCQVYFRVDVD